MNPLTEQMVTVPLKDFLWLSLGQGYWSDRPIPRHIATLIINLTKNRPESGYHIQERDEFGQQLDQPILWQYSFWADDHRRRQIQKRRSEEARQARFVLDANVKLVAKRLQKDPLWLEGDIAQVTAHRLVSKKMSQQLRALGIHKLYETIDEIP